MMRQYHEPQILDDSDDDFDPKTEDINQYCSIIGLDPVKEPDLLWIAKEGILAKLEPPWKEGFTNSFQRLILCESKTAFERLHC